MGKQRNLTEENVEELKAKIAKMQETNPELEYRFYEQDQEKPSNKEMQLSQLIYAVSRKFPGESRFETALRYIREAEEAATGGHEVDKELGAS